MSFVVDSFLMFYELNLGSIRQLINDTCSAWFLVSRIEFVN